MGTCYIKGGRCNTGRPHARCRFLGASAQAYDPDPSQCGRCSHAVHDRDSIFDGRKSLPREDIEYEREVEAKKQEHNLGQAQEEDGSAQEDWDRIFSFEDKKKAEERGYARSLHDAAKHRNVADVEHWLSQSTEQAFASYYTPQPSFDADENIAAPPITPTKPQPEFESNMNPQTPQWQQPQSRTQALNSLLNLSPQEQSAYSYLVDLVDPESLNVITAERAVMFFERTSVPTHVLGLMWGVADTENRGLLTKQEFFVMLRLIGWYQNGQYCPTTELAFQRAPLPKFPGITVPVAE